MRVLGVIPARGGSKGIPRKNIKLLLGKPLIAWSIECARRSSVLADVVVSTDDPEIAEVAQSWGATVPFLRPVELSRDNTPGVMTAIHAAEELPEYDWLLLIQPTTPLRIPDDLDGIVETTMSVGAQAAVSAVETASPPSWTFARTPEGYFNIEPNARVVSRRQDLPRQYSIKGGGLYFSERSWLLRHRSYITPETYMYVMPPERCIDIDTPSDWALAEYFMARRAEQERYLREREL